MEILGIEDIRFTAKDGNEVVGKNLYLMEPIDPTRGQGNRVERVFLSEARLKSLGLTFPLAIGLTVDILYNRFGKLVALRKTADDEVLID